MDSRGLSIVQQRYDPDTKTTHWTEIDSWLTDKLYLHPKFKTFFDKRAKEPEDGLYPTVTIRQIMWALKLKATPKALELIDERFDTRQKHAPLWTYNV